tara:strand:+ start:1663 stop:2127 length:465 start_codon:yes stop_codon:yes gene_type:complete
VNRKNLNIVFNKYSKIFQNSVKNVLRKKKKVASGDTLRSILVKPFSGENSSGLYLYANKTFEFIQSGRRPGRKNPPYSAILRWVKNKPVSLKFGYNEKKAASAIMRGIGQKGIAPTNIAEQALSNILPSLIQEASVAYIKDVETAIKKGKDNVN